MISIEDYGRMIADPLRVGAYAKALRNSIGPGSVVLDLGAGTGIFSLLACKFGARKVYAVEQTDAIAVAQRIAQDNGMAGRVEFIQANSTEVELSEKVDVIVCDMHGALPLNGAHVTALLDARRRMLSAGGVLIPRRESLWAAVVEVPQDYAALASPWAPGEFGLDMQSALRAATNCLRKTSVTPRQMLSEASCWGVLDYATLEQPSHAAEIRFTATRAGAGHGLVLWFDSELADGIGFSNAPGQPELVYGAVFAPWPSPVALDAGDEIAVRLRADFIGDDYTWSWQSAVKRGEVVKARFEQSTFWGQPLGADRLRRRGSAFRPKLDAEGRVDAAILGAMDGAKPLNEIARMVMERFPGHFSSLDEALARVGDLSESYGGEGS
jgi:protein arginine N-methyltransferase 1